MGTNWTELGRPDIDQEHKALARIVRELESAVEAGSQSAVPVLLEQLASYSGFHFQSEESAMRAADFPGLEAHAAEHRKFTAKITVLKYQLYRADLGRELLDLLHGWFRTHTMGSDEQFAAFLRER